jgi:hypothetical protein
MRREIERGDNASGFGMHTARFDADAGPLSDES